MAKKVDGRPRHQQIAAEIRAAILRGDIAVGDRLPKIADLRKQFNVSLRTIQDATQVLKDEGILKGERGQGVFVLTRQPHVVDVAAYFVPSPDAYSYTMLDVAEVQPPADVAKALELPAEGTAILRKRMTLYKGDPVELNWSYYPVEIARGTALERRPKIKGGAPRVLAEAGYPEREFVDRVSVRPPTTEEVEALELPDTVSVICQTRIVYSDERRPVEVTVMAKAGHLYELRYWQTVS